MSKKKNTDFRITPYHVNNSVTGSSVLIEVDGLKILCDLGMFQSQSHKIEDIYKINYKKLNIPFEELDYIILTSSHCDHCCGLGIIGREDINFNGKVIATEMSAELIALNIRDSAHLMYNECKAYNKSHNNKIQPLYTSEEAEGSISQIRGYGYNEHIRLNDNVSFEFLPNGHLSGDGSIYITYKKSEYEKVRVLYTGDTNFGRKKPFTKSWINKTYKADCVISESTYAGKSHLNQDNLQVLEDSIINTCIKEHRILFIPTFAIHRQTEVTYMLKQIYDKNKFIKDNNIPIYFAGVMSNKSHRILGNPKYKCFYDEEWQNLDDVFNWDKINYIENFRDVEEKLTDNKVKIIVASSGMLVGGYANYLAKCFVPRDNVDFLFTGYQAIGSIGDKIMSQKYKTVSIQGKQYPIRCNSLGKLDLSGHADGKHLIELIESLNQNVLKKVIIIHGDDDRKKILKQQLEEKINKNKNKEIIIPKVGQVIKI